MPHTWYRYRPTSVKLVTPAEDFIWDAKYAPLDQWSGPKWFGATTKYAWILAQRAQKQPWTGFTWTNEAIHRLDSHLFADSTLIGNHLHDTQVVSACCLLSTANRRTLFYNSFASAMQTIRQSWLRRVTDFALYQIFTALTHQHHHQSCWAWLHVDGCWRTREWCWVKARFSMQSLPRQFPSDIVMKTDLQWRSDLRVNGKAGRLTVFCAITVPFYWGFRSFSLWRPIDHVSRGQHAFFILAEMQI